MGTLVSFLFVCLWFIVLFCYFFIALLPRASTYLAPLHFHFFRISFSFLAVSHSMDGFFLQSAYTDGIIYIVGAATIDNDFWSCFIEKKIFKNCVNTFFFLRFKLFLFGGTVSSRALNLFDPFELIIK